MSVVCALTSCDKMPENGKLDDMWQVMEITIDGTTTNVKDTKMYWGIRYNLVQFFGNGDKKFAHFKREGNQLVITDLCHDSANATEADNNEWITESEADVMHKWGVWPVADTDHPGRLMQTYNIDVLTSSEMILSSTDGKTRIAFRKF